MRGLKVIIIGLISITYESTAMLRQRLCGQRMCTRCARILNRRAPTNRAHAQLCIAMFNSNDCCKADDPGYLFPATEGCEAAHFPLVADTSLTSQIPIVDELVESLENDTLECNDDQFCQVLKQNFNQEAHCTQAKDNSSLVVLSMVVLVISLLISGVVGVIYRCQTEKGRLREKHNANFSTKEKDRARLLETSSPSSEAPAIGSTYDTFDK